MVDRLLVSGDYAFDPRCAVTAQSGRGGNFALGYAGSEVLCRGAVEAMRKQSEACHGGHLGGLERPKGQMRSSLRLLNKGFKMF